MFEIVKDSPFMLHIQHDKESKMVSVRFDNFDWAKAEGQAFANDYWYHNVWIERNGDIVETIRG